MPYHKSDIVYKYSNDRHKKAHLISTNTLTILKLEKGHVAIQTLVDVYNYTHKEIYHSISNLHTEYQGKG